MRPERVAVIHGGLRRTWKDVYARKDSSAWQSLVALNAELKKKGVKGAFAHKVRYSFEEPDLYGKPTAAFTLVYTFSGVLPDIMLQACSLFRPVPGSNWTQWIASVASSVGGVASSMLAGVLLDSAGIDVVML